MLSKNEKKTIRKMFHRMFVVNLQQGCNISGTSVLEIYLSSLWIDEQKITLKQYQRYMSLSDKYLDNYYNQSAIMSFRGL